MYIWIVTAKPLLGELVAHARHCLQIGCCRRGNERSKISRSALAFRRQAHALHRQQIWNILHPAMHPSHVFRNSSLNDIISYSRNKGRENKVRQKSLPALFADQGYKSEIVELLMLILSISHTGNTHHILCIFIPDRDN